MEVKGGSKYPFNFTKKEEKINEITKTTGSDTSDMGRRRIH